MQALRSGFFAQVVLAGAILLAGCDVSFGPSSTPIAPTRPEAGIQSAASLKAEAYYSRVQNSLLTHGLLRTDGGGPDVPFNARNLTQNFLRIAFYQEYSERSGRLIAHEDNSTLHRWANPIRYDVTFGASVPESQRQIDTREVARYTSRLSGLTGLNFTPSETRTNLHIFIVNEDERERLGPELKRIVPGISPAALSAALDMARDTYCLAFAASSSGSSEYAQGVIIIRGEHPDLLRRACIHEEIAQSLGLPNDSADARPSIFNDDGEFGLLTAHDELLLRMLYDRRLTPGMTEAEARPIVTMIAAELIGGSA
ncbi:MAG: DUF2927 domain-containing protein [Rhodobacteraceae bacterium]|nr:DUF2927 domain-containing protein [Paracoccaceae bacterium]